MTNVVELRPLGSESPEFFETKACTKCGATKPLTEFNKDRSRKDGLEAQCRTCRNEAKRLRNKTQTRTRKKLTAQATKESEARRMALLKLVENHPQEFHRLLGDARRTLGFAPRWVGMHEFKD